MRAKLLTLCFLLSTAVCAEPFNMAYVEVNSNQLSNTGCYLRSDTQKPLFNMVSIFAANINGTAPNQPVVYFNPQVDHLLNHTQQVSELQNKGIKVLLTLLGNHQNAGWSCMTDENAINEFADKIVAVVNFYHLDGVDIDDEYSRCQSNDTSMIRLAKAIKTHPNFKNKILSKALFADGRYFAAHYQGNKLADFLDGGWEMTYFSPDYHGRLNSYVKYGMSKSILGLGLSVGNGKPKQAVAFIKDNEFGGLMAYNVTTYSYDYLAEIAKEEFGTNLILAANCLK